VFTLADPIPVSVTPAEGATMSTTATGDLTVHGVTRRVSLPVVMTVSGDQLRATGEATIKQTDFDMKPYSGGLGLIKIRDEVKITFTVIARG
jgi:polyisoprenoid-binding protein YceI